MRAQEFQALMKQRTWDKEVVLWIGSEKSLLEAVGSTHHLILDLLDLFDPDSLPADVKSIGLLVRYEVGLKDFYDWFVNSQTVVVLLLEGLTEATKWPGEVLCDANRLFRYFDEPGMVKNMYDADR